MLRIHSWDCVVYASVVSLSLVSATLAVDIETVPVGNPGNTGELSGAGAGGYGPDRVCGAVNYVYNIGKYEVTAGQYCEFLNSVAQTDTYGLYERSMWTSSKGCKIRRIGSSGSFTYTVASDRANRPVNWVSWGDAARFANWLHNGQPMGSQDLSTTEDGAYNLTETHPYYNPDGSINDFSALRAALLAVSRETDWKWAITSEDEWYKAAYHKNNGVTGNYWVYPTASNDLPSNDLITPDPGNNANFYIYSGGDYTIGSPYWMTEVGEFENSESPYGTFDQCGNIWEWNEAIIDLDRGVRGGSFNNYDYMLPAAYRSRHFFPMYEGHVGFRLVQILEPITLSLDILPGSDRNPFVPNKKDLGRIPMVILATEEVAAEDIVPESIKIAGVLSPVKTSTDKDVNGDGLVDLAIHFSRRGFIDALSLDTYEVDDVVDVTITANRVADDWPIEATDSIVIVGHND